MAAYDLEEQEQLAQLKAWWNEYGNLVTVVMLVCSAIALAYQGWNWYQRSQASEAAAIYGAVQRAQMAGDAQKTKQGTAELVDNYSRTPYAPLAALASAKSAVDVGDLKTAQLQLQWVVDHGKDEVRDIGRLRLAAVLAEQKEFDAAVKQLDTTPSSGFVARFAELKGDILLLQGNKEAARAAYQQAQSKLDEAAKADGAKNEGRDEHEAPRTPLQQKLDAVGGSK